MVDAKVIEKVEKFNPVTIELTFNSQDELDIFTSIFAYTPICDLLKIEVDDVCWCEYISDVCHDAGGKYHVVKLQDGILSKVSFGVLKEAYETRKGEEEELL